MQVMYRRRACTQVLFLRKAELGFFQAGWYVLLVRRSQHSLAGPFLPQKVPLAANRFLQVGKGAENIKEKSRHCFTWYVRPQG
jgi:hypothetical protein